MTAHSESPRVKLMLQIQFYWRLIFAVLAMIAAISPWSGWVPLSVLWQKILLSIVLLAVAVFSIVGAAQIARRKHSGRIISLTLDYLGFVFCFIITINTGEVFTGIDALGETFGQGVPYLGIVLLGYLVGTLDDRFPQQNKSSTTSLKAVSRWVMIAGFILFLWQVEAVNGLLYFLEKLAQPVGIVAVAGMLVFGLSRWSLMREEVAQALHAKTNHEQVINGWLFLSPNLLGFLIFFAGPLVLSFYFSFTDSDAFNPPNWVGLENYARILNVLGNDNLSRIDLIDI